MHDLRAIMVCVDYSDLLAITLPYNRHQFDRVMVVTSTADFSNVLPICLANKAEILSTDLFYKDGAKFNKWRALEWALDVYGRDGWLCVMDADVLWPKYASQTLKLIEGTLISPFRRMWDDWPELPPGHIQMKGQHYKAGPNYIGGPEFSYWIPGEESWDTFYRHRNVGEHAGYTQIFHASDPALGPPPWHDINWEHAGGADSFFQLSWPAEKKVRPPFEVLHLGPAGRNWYGRSTTYADGVTPAHSAERYRASMDIWEERRRLRREGATLIQATAGERITPTPL